MGGVAALAKAAGHEVTGCDAGVYPPMSDQLTQLGISVTEGYAAGQLDLDPDVFVIGNAMSRGNALVEAILDQRRPYLSGPEWLARYVLADRRVVAVAGTHGKTTTSSIIAHGLEQAGLAPGFLIGGVPANFGKSARLGDGEWFVVEADEYDSAFFDKRAKFVHYRPEIAVLNNLEFDHADIYPDLAAIQRQFHHLVRTVPSSGRLIVNKSAEALQEVLTMGAWTPVTEFSTATGASVTVTEVDDSRVACLATEHGEPSEFTWSLTGQHNLENAAAASGALLTAGLDVNKIAAALKSFDGVARRQQILFELDDQLLLDDFAHHPTAIGKTVSGLRAAYPNRKLVVALELRSNTMKSGIHRDVLAEALDGADSVLVFRPDDIGFDLAAAVQPLGAHCRIFDDYGALGDALLGQMEGAVVAVIMSNGGFGTLRQDAPARLAGRNPRD